MSVDSQKIHDVAFDIHEVNSETAGNFSICENMLVYTMTSSTDQRSEVHDLVELLSFEFEFIIFIIDSSYPNNTNLTINFVFLLTGLGSPFYDDNCYGITV